MNYAVKYLLQAITVIDFAHEIDKPRKVAEKENAI